jgi:hypothetical protein
MKTSYTAQCEKFRKKVLAKGKKATIKEKPTTLEQLARKREQERLRRATIQQHVTDEQKQEKYDKKKEYHQWLRNNGMNARGYVRKNYNIMVDTPSLPKNSPLYHSTPFYVLRELPHDLVMEARKIEELLFAREVVGGWHRYGGNKGVNFGYQVCGGGGYACKEEGRSGTIKACTRLDHMDAPCDRDRLWKFVANVLNTVYGEDGWYKQAVAIAEKLNAENKIDRCIPGTPISGIWITSKTKEEAVHIDTNVVGPTFVFSVFEGADPVYLNVSSQDGTKNRKATLSCQILAGNWAKVPHCNSNTKRSNKKRRSWTLYTDYHIFSRLYWDLEDGKIHCKKCQALCGFNFHPLKKFNV